MADLNISNLASDLQKNLRDNPFLFTLLLSNGVAGIPYFTYFDDVDDEMDLSQLVTGDPNQPGNRGSFAPKSNVHEFKARIAKVRNCEVALKFTEANIEALHRTHLQKKRRSNPNDPYDFAFKDVVMQRTLDAMWSNKRKKALFKGVLNASGTSSSDLYNGILTILAADITASKVPAGNVATGAAITASNAEAQVNLVRDTVIAQQPEYIDEELICLMAPENMVHYNTNYQANHGALPYNTDFRKMKVEGLGNCTITPEIGMTGSDRIIITTMDNLVLCSNLSLSNAEMKAWEEHWDLDLGAKYKAQPDYVFAELMFCNDQA